MIGDLKPYSAYKDSAVAWVETIPKSWSILRGKNVFRTIDVRSTTGDEELLTVSSADGVVPRSQKTVTMFKAESYVGHKLCWTNDLVINSLWAWMQGLGFTKYHGLVSSAYSVYRPLPKFIDYVRYFHWLIRSDAYKWELQTRSKGVWLSRLQLSDMAFLDMPILLPPIEDQEAIATFLDYADRRIRRYIRSKQKLIKLLEEQKQVVINEVVTRGLDPNVPMKRSEIEWLGDIPEHWEIIRLSGVADVIDPNPSHRNPIYVDDGFPFISTVEFIGTDDILLTTSRKVDESTVIEQERRCLFPDGSIAFSRKGTIGSTRILPFGVRFALLDSVCVINCKTNVNYQYLYRQLGSTAISTQCSEFVRGAALKQISVGKVRNLRVIVPPLSEQAQIVNFIDPAVSKISLSIKTAQTELSLLREFRTRLIADVVTGKLDVREAASKLPVEVDEPAVLEEDLDEDGIGLEDELDPDAALEDEVA